MLPSQKIINRVASKKVIGLPNILVKTEVVFSKD
jgi:hypothetical protein